MTLNFHQKFQKRSPLLLQVTSQDYASLAVPGFLNYAETLQLAFYTQGDTRICISGGCYQD